MKREKPADGRDKSVLSAAGREQEKNGTAVTAERIGNTSRIIRTRGAEFQWNDETGRINLSNKTPLCKIMFNLLFYRRK